MKPDKREKVNIYGSVFADDIVAGFTAENFTGKDPEELGPVLKELGIRAGMANLEQDHGAYVKTAAGPGLYPGDGLFTAEKGLLIFVRTADCLPLLFHSGKMGIIGAVHMGWRSAEQGILSNIPYELDTFKVVAGPGLRKCCFEAGREFLEKSSFKKFLELRGARAAFDPVSFARENLEKKGLKPENFIDTGICSFCSGAEGIHSFRKTGTERRNLSFIVNRQCRRQG